MFVFKFPVSVMHKVLKPFLPTNTPDPYSPEYDSTKSRFRVTRKTKTVPEMETSKIESSDLFYPLAPLYPFLISYQKAQTDLKKAIIDITRYKGFKLLQLISRDGKTREYQVKNGVWAGKDMRMFFCLTDQSAIKRVYIQIDQSGYPCILDPEFKDEFDVRISLIKADLPEKEFLPQSNQKLDPITQKGKMPPWATSIAKLAKDYEEYCNQCKNDTELKLMDFAQVSHDMACKILGLNPFAKTILKKEVEYSFRRRMKIIHPDKAAAYELDTKSIAKALAWAKEFLCPI